NDIGHILDHTGDGRDFVLYALDLDLGDGAALQAGQEDAPQAVADGDAKAAFERLGIELSVCVRQGRPIGDHAAWQLQSAPPNSHVTPSSGKQQSRDRNQTLSLTPDPCFLTPN